MSSPELGDWHQHRRCTNCGELYDARAQSCYVCGDEDTRDHGGSAAFRAAQQAKMNGHLSAQMQVANQERAAEQTLRSARASGSADAFARARPRVPGYNTLVEGLKNSLENNPRALDFFSGKD